MKGRNMLGTTEIVIIVGVVVVLFGASAIPKLAKSIGKARAEFEKGIKVAKDEEEEGKSEDAEEKKKESNK